MRTAKEIIDMFMPHADWNNENGNAEKSTCIKNAKACAILYVDGQIEAVQQLPVSVHVEDMLKKLELLKQEIYRV